MCSLNNLESYSRISALGPVGHCTSHFKRAVCISCRPCMDKGGGRSGPCGRMWTGGRGVKNGIFCGRHKWMAPMQLFHAEQQYSFLNCSFVILFAWAHPTVQVLS